MMVRMERMREARFFDTTHSLAMDQELGIRLAELGPFERIDEPLYEVTLHGDHLSQKLEQKEAALLYIVQKTLAREPYLRDRCLLREATGQVHLRLASAAYSQEAAPLARRHLSTTFRVWPWAWRRPSTLLLALKVLLGRRFVQSVAKRMGRGTGPKWQRNRSPRDDPRDP